MFFDGPIAEVSYFLCMVSYFLCTLIKYSFYSASYLLTGSLSASLLLLLQLHIFFAAIFIYNLFFLVLLRMCIDMITVIRLRYPVWQSSRSYIHSLLPSSFGCHNLFFCFDGCLNYMVTVIEVKIWRFRRLISSMVSLYPLGLFGSCTPILDIFGQSFNEQGFLNLVYMAFVVISLWYGFCQLCLIPLLFVLASFGSYKAVK